MRAAVVGLLFAGTSAGCMAAGMNLHRASARAIVPTPYPDSVTISEVHHGVLISRWVATTHDGGNYYMARILGFTPTFLPPTGTSANPASSSGAYFKLNDVAAPLRSTGWHNLKVEISTSNGTSQDYNFFVDGVLSKTISGIGTVLRSYDTQRIGSGVSSTNSAFYDNYSFELVAIPEPVTLGAVGMGMLLLVRRRR